MLRAVWGTSGFDFEEYEPGALAPGSARLAVRACGICGSDLHTWHSPGERRPLGIAPGHEFVGTLIDGPPGLADVLYAIRPLVACGSCRFCQTGRMNLCRRGGPGFGIGGHGGLAETVDAPIENLAPVTTDDPVIGAMTEPLAVALRAVNLARPQPDSTVLILGGGMIGLACALHARDRAGTVAITTRYPHQRAVAESLGVTAIGEDELRPWAKGHRPDITIETVGGRADTVNDAIVNTERGGTMVIAGIFDERPSIDINRLIIKELRLLGSFCFATNVRESEYVTAATRTGPWEQELRRFATHQIPIGEVDRAFETAADKTSEAIKVTVVHA